MSSSFHDGVYVYIHIHTCIYTCIYIYVSIHVYVYIYIYMHMQYRWRAHMYVNYVYTHMYTCTYVYMHICILQSFHGQDTSQKKPSLSRFLPGLRRTLWRRLAWWGAVLRKWRLFGHGPRYGDEVEDELTMKVSGYPTTHTCFLNGGYGISPSWLFWIQVKTNLCI